MARGKTRFRIVGEYAAARGLLLVTRLLPVRASLGLADLMGDLAYLLDRAHRRVALGNLAQVFGGAPSDRVHKQMARRVFRHFVRVGTEFALLPRLIEKGGLDQVIEVAGKEHVLEAQRPGRGIVVFSAHLGNWEVIAAAGEPLGLKLHSVGRALDNPLLDRFLARERGRYARSVIPKEGGLPRIARALRQGDSVAMLLDQHAGRRGIEVDFLGRPASTFRAAAELAVRFDLPLLGGFGIRVDRAPRFLLQFEPPLWPDRGAPREEEVRRLTQAVSDTIARQVRSHPDQWNWLHRRWRQRRQKRRRTQQEQEAST
ncbi:MAG: lysophospholipid acyltransferase family protein [Planctomycetes bacterium]|nr:lysophospholipid acyltransferase family protein [Planctomycetota bacterium]